MNQSIVKSDKTFKAEIQYCGGWGMRSKALSVNLDLKDYFPNVKVETEYVYVPNAFDINIYVPSTDGKDTKVNVFSKKTEGKLDAQKME